MKNITFKDYWRMKKARGLKLPIQYFFQNHLFDIVRGTDTHFRLEKQDYEKQPEAFDSGVLYMSSVTKEVKAALQRVKKHSGEQFFDFQFFDLGCGKGKTMMVYVEQAGKAALHKAVGIDYYQPLVQIAEKNLKLRDLEGKALAAHDDARHFLNYATSSKLIVYLYNPFGREIVSEVLESCKKHEVYVIYTDPEWEAAVMEQGFERIFEGKGAFPNRNTSIFYRQALQS